ncbi:MAG TPA: ATP-binding protein [Bacillota bacterium]
MKELSLHILDLAQNSLRAGADLIEVIITERTSEDRMTIEIRDNGKGMTTEELERVFDPFYTTRKTRRIGLGLPLFQAAAVRCGGDVTVHSQCGVGTRIIATFQLSHWDKPPLGEISETIVSLIVANPGVSFVYLHQREHHTFTFDTRELCMVLKEVPLTAPAVVEYMRKYINEGDERLTRASGFCKNY